MQVDRRIQTGIAGSTPVKTHRFDKQGAPTTIPKASPNSSSAGSGGKSVLRTTEEREELRRKREEYIRKIEREDQERALSGAGRPPPPALQGELAFGSPEVSPGGRPKTSRGSSRPSPDDFADYVVMSPTKDLPKNGEVMKFGNDNDFYPSNNATEKRKGVSSGRDRLSELRNRGVDYDESYGDEASSGGSSRGDSDIVDVDDDEDDFESDSEDSEYEYDEDYEDNIFTPNLSPEPAYPPPAPNNYSQEDYNNSTMLLEKEYARQGRALIALALSL
ncbi:hypothetical protein TL16_g09379 [Triparma laevis f. inornata]|uniref:Uncharacterized protein n=1 Tax=Triparma laevis f. inornata TaxID=1714386 RepID=A0A9W7B2P1_9STRA|nr:hypothetical protein TL16_g09379 [Triparma laevis f. inornata]